MIEGSDSTADGPKPAVPGPAQAAVAALFGALSGLRGKRIFHPDGVAFEASVRVAKRTPELAGTRLLAEPGDHRALVRLSRGAGLPGGLPDALGLATRLLDVHGPGRHQDFLLITSGGAPLTRHLILPAPAGFFGHGYSSLLLYRLGERIALIGASSRSPRGRGVRSLRALAEAVEREPTSFELTWATLTGPWRCWGRLEVGARLADAAADKLSFNPWHTGGGIRPVGPFMGLRLGAYAGSQAARSGGG
jgi:hypothetical protein